MTGPARRTGGISGAASVAEAGFEAPAVKAKTAPSDREDDLASDVARLDRSVRLGGLLEGGTQPDLSP